MIVVSPYTKDNFDILCMMHETQNSPTLHDLTPDTLPAIGFIASEGAIHVAMGFLRMVEGGVGQIDTLVTNADVSAQMRNEALDEVVSTILHTAKQLKLKGIISFTKDESVLMRAVATGFLVSPQTMLVLSL